MDKRKKPDIHKAGIFYTCYSLTQLGYEAIDTTDADAHVMAKKDGKNLRLNVNAKTSDNASPFNNLDLKFDYLVILTHILEEPNVYILSKDQVHNLLEKTGPDSKGTYWLSIDDYRKNGQYWDILS